MNSTITIPPNIYIREKSWFARLAAWKLNADAAAMVFGNAILLHGVSKENFLDNEKWLKHELQHIAQFRKHGKLGFLWKYFIEWMRHGYYNNQFEIEARAAEYWSFELIVSGIENK